MMPAPVLMSPEGILIDTSGTECCCGGEPVNCLDCAGGGCTSVTMHISGYVAASSDFGDVTLLNDVSIPMVMNPVCNWSYQQGSASGDCQQLPPGGSPLDFDCALAVNNASLDCQSGDPDRFKASIRVGSDVGADGSWCYERFVGPCPPGGYLTFIDPGGGPCSEHGQIPNQIAQTPGSLNLS